MKLKKYVCLYSKPLANHTVKIMKNTWKFTKKPGKIMEFYQSRKVGTLGSPVISFALVTIEVSAKSRHSSKFTKMIYLCFEWAVLIREMWVFFFTESSFRLL